jgi:fructoselysine-6-P-deglycase FrlB-like protein
VPAIHETHLAAEIATQPSDWRRVLQRVGEAQSLLPQPGQSIAVVGCGTSLYMAQVYASLREAAGHGRTEAHAASEFPALRDYDHVVAISRSGTTTEVVELLEWLRSRGQVTTSIVATAGTPIPALTTRQLMLGEVDEESVVQTRFATTALALLRATLGENLEAAIADAEAVLAEDVSTALTGVVDAEQITFVGRGWTVGLANEAGLKLRESAQFWTEAYPAMEYRHGPISIATTGRATWAFGEVPAGLAEDVTATGAHFEHRDIDPMADLVRLHRLCLAKAEQAGVDPDRPRHLARSIILT